MKTQVLFASLLSLLVFGGMVRAGDEAELNRLQGRWEVAELIEDGTVIQRERIREWLPSGGRAEIIENTIVFTSPHDGQKHAKTFEIEPSSYPKGMHIKNRDQVEALGIYKFDGNRLVMCLANPKEAPRPTDFSAASGSRRILMVLTKLADSNPNPNPGAVTPRPPVQQLPANPPNLQPVGVPVAAPATPTPTPVSLPAIPPQLRPVGIAGGVITDAQVSQMLLGTWKFVDQFGAMYVTAAANGTYSTTREVRELRRFQEVFVRTPVTSGTWIVQNGQLTFRVVTSSVPNRAGQIYAFSIRSISAKDLIFVDGLGRVGAAARVQ